MLSRISAIGLALAMAASLAVVHAQDAPGDSSDPKPDDRQAAAPAATSWPGVNRPTPPDKWSEWPREPCFPM